MTDGYGLVVRFTVKAGHEEAFDQLVSETLEGIRGREPGTLVYGSHRVAEQPGLRIFYELYSDRAAFEAHEEQPHVKHFLSERAQHLDAVEVDFVDLLDGKTPTRPS